jgi:hypothetical protein
MLREGEKQFKVMFSGFSGGYQLINIAWYSKEYSIQKVAEEDFTPCPCLASIPVFLSHCVAYTHHQEQTRGEGRNNALVCRYALTRGFKEWTLNQTLDRPLSTLTLAEAENHSTNLCGASLEAFVYAWLRQLCRSGSLLDGGGTQVNIPLQHRKGSWTWAGAEIESKTLSFNFNPGLYIIILHCLVVYV